MASGGRRPAQVGGAQVRGRGARKWIQFFAAYDDLDDPHDPALSAPTLMGLSTHVLDTMHGCPAAGMALALYAPDGPAATLLKPLVLNRDGRTDAPLFDNASLRTGTYRLCFDVAGSFQTPGPPPPPPPLTKPH